jgi:hypothetical protein
MEIAWPPSEICVHLNAGARKLCIAHPAQIERAARTGCGAKFPQRMTDVVWTHSVYYIVDCA